MDEDKLRQSEIDLKETVQLKTTSRYIIWSFFICFLLAPMLLFLIWSYLTKPPVEFPLNQDFVIETGSSLRQIVKQAKEANLIRSEYIFLTELKFHRKADSVKAGKYSFEKPLTTAELAEQFFLGNPKADLINLTHIEGESVKSFAIKTENKLTNFSAAEFIEINKLNEGFLFPETYFVPKDFTAVELTELMLETFTEKTKELNQQNEEHFLSWNEIIILASILEREANSEESKKMVSGILQNRLKLGMALQADASIEYVLDKPLSKLTPADLEIDSPYNTYLYPGLPPTPIGNPGLATIEAVLHPTESDYYFYITGNDGNFYYAKTFDEHRRNIALYLR